MAATGRRTFIAHGAAFLATPPVAAAQQTGRVYRLGVLRQTVPEPPSPRSEMISLTTGLRELGYVEGQNLATEHRFAGGRIERLPELARELVQLKMDAIVAVAPNAIRAARDATTTIPIVMYGGVDPIATGIVASLARPGGNLTGVLIAPGITLVGKKLELLKEMVPRAARIGFLSPDNSGAQGQVPEAQKAAASLNLKLVVAEVQDGNYERAFDTLVAERPSALFVANSPTFMRDRKRIIDLVSKHRLPAMYEWSEQVEDGGLMSYGSSQTWVSRRVAAYVVLIFKGAKPGDLPIEQPSKFELVINLKTAKALGLTIPPSLLARADQVIE
jgi:putative tryptophan/tyrosine transport system substrate-binding protein